MYTHTHTHTHMYMYIYVHVCVYVCMCVCVYVCVCVCMQDIAFADSPMNKILLALLDALVSSRTGYTLGTPCIMCSPMNKIL